MRIGTRGIPASVFIAGLVCCSVILAASTVRGQEIVCPGQITPNRRVAFGETANTAVYKLTLEQARANWAGRVRDPLITSSNPSVPALGYCEIGTQAFRRWLSANPTHAGTAIDLVIPPQAQTSGGYADMSVVGYSDNGFFTRFHAFHWTEGTGLVDLGTLDPPNNSIRGSIATGISQNGSIIVGYSDIAGGLVRHAFRWTAATGMVDLGSPAPGRESRALAINGAGDVIVGDAVFADPAAFTGFRSGAFRWTAAGGFQSLGALQPGFFTLAADVTPDGSVIVGQGGVEVFVGGVSTNGSRGFRWTAATGMQVINPFPGHTGAAAVAVSDNGNVVVGTSGVFTLQESLFQGYPGGTAFRWTAATGPQDLRQLLVDAGLNMTGITLRTATAVSADGQWVAGDAITPLTPEGETSAYIVKYCDAAITGTCLELPAPVATFFASAGTSSTLTVAAGQSVNATLTVTPSGGFTQLVTFACSGLPAGTTCTFAPSTVTPTGSAATTNLTIRTSSGSTAIGYALAATMLLVSGVVVRRRRSIPLARHTGSAMIIAAIACGFSACSDSQSPGGGTPTPPGTYPITVTASSGSGASAVSRTVAIQLTVTP